MSFCRTTTPGCPSLKDKKAERKDPCRSTRTCSFVLTQKNQKITAAWIFAKTSVDFPERNELAPHRRDFKQRFSLNACHPLTGWGRLAKSTSFLNTNIHQADEEVSAATILHRILRIFVLFFERKGQIRDSFQFTCHFEGGPVSSGRLAMKGCSDSHPWLSIIKLLKNDRQGCLSD